MNIKRNDFSAAAKAALTISKMAVLVTEGNSVFLAGLGDGLILKLPVGTTTTPEKPIQVTADLVKAIEGLKDNLLSFVLSATSVSVRDQSGEEVLTGPITYISMSNVITGADSMGTIDSKALSVAIKQASLAFSKAQQPCFKVSRLNFQGNNVSLTTMGLHMAVKASIPSSFANGFAAEVVISNEALVAISKMCTAETGMLNVEINSQKQLLVLSGPNGAVVRARWASEPSPSDTSLWERKKDCSNVIRLGAASAKKMLTGIPGIKKATETVAFKIIAENGALRYRAVNGENISKGTLDGEVLAGCPGKTEVVARGKNLYDAIAIAVIEKVDPEISFSEKLAFVQAGSTSIALTMLV